MAYVTLAQSKQYLGTDLYNGAYDDFVTPGTPDDTVLTEDIDYTTGVIDGYIKQTYNSTITGTQSLNILRSISERLLKYKAYERFDSEEIPDMVQVRYDRALMELKEIASGDMLLPDETQDIKPSPINWTFNSATENSTDNSTLFKRSNMRGI